MGHIGPAADAAVPALIEAIQDPDVDVRQAAIDALEQIDPAAARAVSGRP